MDEHVKDERWILNIALLICQKKERNILNFKYCSKRHLNASISINYSSAMWFKEFWRRWLMKIKLIFTRKVLDVASVWKWWLLELGHELFIIKISSLEIRLSQSWCPFFQYFNSFRFCHRHDRCIVTFILNQLNNPTGNFFWAVKKRKKLSMNWKFMTFCGFRRTPELRAPG